MGSVYRKTVTKAVPTGAEIFTRKGERFARWKDAKGRTRTAPLTVNPSGNDRIVIQSRYVAQYRDGSGHVRVVSTGCRDEMAARSILADLERRAELVRANVITADEDAIADHQPTPLAEHFTAYDQYLLASGTTKTHRESYLRAVRRLAADCGFGQLADLDRSALERWLVQRAVEGMAARTRNAYREAAIAFCNWCIGARRLVSNPFAGVPKADAKADPRRQRRSLTEAELVRLLEVARQRPLLDAMTVRRGARRGEAHAKLRPETTDRLEWLGRERALIYKTLVLTGLRKNELASLTVGQLDLEGPVAQAELQAADEKNRQGCSIAIRSDLAADLRQWLADKLERSQRGAMRSEGQACLPMTGIPNKLPPDTSLFTVPAGLVRILDRDLVLAGIARRVESRRVKLKGGGERTVWRVDKRDERGRTIDVHALRTTFGTLLSKGGVPLRTAQAAMRHSTPELTANVYTDPKLLDVHGALDALPELSLASRPAEKARMVASATGTDSKAASPFAPAFALGFAGTEYKPGQLPTNRDTVPENEAGRLLVATVQNVKGKAPLTIPDCLIPNRGDRIRTCDFMVPNPLAQRSNGVSNQHVAESGNPVCTSVCTSDAENGHGSGSNAPEVNATQHPKKEDASIGHDGRVERLAALIGELSHAEREQLVARLMALAATGGDTKRTAKTKRRASKPKKQPRRR